LELTFSVLELTFKLRVADKNVRFARGELHGQFGNNSVCWPS